MEQLNQACKAVTPTKNAANMKPVAQAKSKDSQQQGKDRLELHKHNERKPLMSELEVVNREH